MSSKRCSVENCGNTVTTTRGTYTFYSDRLKKSEAAKTCKKHGGIIAPLNTQEEFDAVHKFAYKCQPWCSVNSYYHVGLYVMNNDTRFYSDCTEWDWNKHDKLYFSDMNDGPCYESVYMPYFKIQDIIAKDCKDYKRRFICFNDANDSSIKKTSQEALVHGNNAEGFNRFAILSAFLATLTVGLAVALVKANKKLKEFKKNTSC